MSTASSLLLLTLIVNVQLCSPAPRPASLAQFPFAAEEPGLEGFELAEVKDGLQEGSSGEVAPSPETSLPEKDFINTAEVPGFTGEPASAGPHDAVSRESDPPDFLKTAPQEYLIDDNGFNASLEDAEVDALHVDVEGESPDQEEPVLMAPMSSEDGAPLERSEEAGPTLVIIRDDPRGPESPEEEKSDVLVPVETQVEEVDQYESVMEETAPGEPASSNTSEAPQFEEQQVFVYAVLEEPEEAVTPEQAEDQSESAAEEMQASGSQDAAAIVSLDSSGEELRCGEQVIKETISLVPPPEQDTQAEAHPTCPQESAPENLTLVVPLKDPDEEVSEDYAEEQILSDLLPQEDLDEHNEPDERDPDRLTVSATEATSQSRTTGPDPAEDVPPAATEIVTGSSAHSVTSPAPASTDADVQSVPASVKGATDVDFTAESVLTGDEAGGQRGEEHLTRDAADPHTEQHRRSAAGDSLHQVSTTRRSLTETLLPVTLLIFLQSLVA